MQMWLFSESEWTLSLPAQWQQAKIQVEHHRQSCNHQLSRSAKLLYGHKDKVPGQNPTIISQSPVHAHACLSLDKKMRPSSLLASELPGPCTQHGARCPAPSAPEAIVWGLMAQDTALRNLKPAKQFKGGQDCASNRGKRHAVQSKLQCRSRFAEA